MEQNKILNISIPIDSKHDILEKIKKYLIDPKGYFHVVSLNPENLIASRTNLEFDKIVKTAQIKIIDGIGIVIASQILGIKVGERYPGVDLMKEVVTIAQQLRLKVLLIGGRTNLALRLAQCYQRQFLEAKFFGCYGIKNIKNPQVSEEKEISSIVTDYKPHIIFVAFGSPDQELWIGRHKNQFNNCLVMGVGGAFDFLSGKIARAPQILRKIGLEWLFRLLIQPWRIKRQLRLIQFLWLVLQEKFSRN